MEGEPAARASKGCEGVADVAAVKGGCIREARHCSSACACSCPLRARPPACSAHTANCPPLLCARVYPPGMHVVVKGFVTNMPEMMSASGACVWVGGVWVGLGRGDYAATAAGTRSLLLVPELVKARQVRGLRFRLLLMPMRGSADPVIDKALSLCPRACAPCPISPSVACHRLPADLIITKAGPGTISEALICGLPMVLNAFVPCQEEGNIPYVTENKVGKLLWRGCGRASQGALGVVTARQESGCWGCGGPTDDGRSNRLGFVLPAGGHF